MQETTWESVLRAVRKDFPELYRSWFAELPAGQLERGELRILVDDHARATYLSQNCTQAFVQAVMSAFGHLVSVRFISPGRPEDGVIRATGSTAVSPAELNPDYTFDQFVVGPSNRLAHAACRAVCEKPGVLYNPLFIHGASGLGKTHLLQAACTALLSAKPSSIVIYLSCEAFVNGFIRAIETGDLPSFRDSIRKADALIIDDVQFLEARESSQEELFHTFNTLYQGRGQIILSADSPPSEIPTLEDRLVSRFNWGLVTEVGPPNRETRQAILQKKAKLRGLEIPDDVLDFIAERVELNVRLLEGALTKLVSESQIGGRRLTLETAREVLEGASNVPTKPLQVSDILDVVSKHYGVRLSDLIGRKRSRSVSYPRQMGMYLARRLTPLSLEEIGVHFGGRDHSTVLHADKVIEASKQHDKETAETLSLLTRKLMERL